MEWLRNRPLILEWDDVVCVHAGLHPKWTNLRKVAKPLEEQIRNSEIPFHSNRLAFMTRVRHCNAKGKRPRPSAADLSAFRPWDEFYTGERIVACGHWALRGLVVKDNLRSLDSGCVWGGSLTAWVCEEDRIVSVPAEKAYQRVRR
jgi:bis(5'-nucleosyl)-tetraphosphatase (symmetrical)